MVRMSKLRAKNKEETDSLVRDNPTSNGIGVGELTSPSGLSRLKTLLWVVLVGCFAIYLWDALEWDDATGDVQLKLYSGSKQDTTGTNLDGSSSTSSSESENGSDIDSVAQKATPEVQKETETPVVVQVTAAPAKATSAATTPASNSNDCPQKCDTAAFDAAHFDGADLTQAASMKARLQNFRQKWIDGYMKDQYGDYYQDIFEPIIQPNNTRVNVGKQLVLQPPNRLPLPGNPKRPDTTGPGWHRMIRKYQIKLLQVQLGIIQAQLDPKQYCTTTQCQPPTEAHQMKENHFAKFMWVNGGHSASAGHGNFYPESYTANLGRDLQPILSAIGLDWQVRNYAMGGESLSYILPALQHSFSF